MSLTNRAGALSFQVFQQEGISIMYRLIAMTSIVLLGLAGSAFAQASMGMDSSGRYDGSAPLGTGRADQAPSGGFSIPLDAFETGSTSSGTIQWNCPQQQSKRTPANQVCSDNQ
jgi:hypothetical protein